MDAAGRIYAATTQSGKRMNDAIHGPIAVHPLLVALIDTKQFQRLRNIKMLGTAYFVFNSANHTRFEHCIGVSHLSGKFVISLSQRQPELEISEQDILAVMIAGLCHDLGHGPFSHTFERFMCEVNPKFQWKHESASLAMLRYLLAENKAKLDPLFSKYVFTEKDIEFVEELITGVRGSARPPEKGFLFEIVANKQNGIDVDRMDYFDRDCYHCNVKSAFEAVRFLDAARVVSVDGEWHICFQDKFRCDLHKRIYQHKTVRLIEQMVVDALVSADPYLLFPDEAGKMYRMSEAVNNMPVFYLLDDSVLSIIRIKVEPGLKTAQNLFGRIFTRNLYSYVARTTPSAELDYDPVLLKIELSRAATIDMKQDVKVEDIVLVKTVFDYGMGLDNPMNCVYFFHKDKPDEPRRLPPLEVSRMLPENWQEEALHVYYKNRDAASVEALRFAVERWSAKRKLILHTFEDSLDPLEMALQSHPEPDTVPPDSDPASEQLFEIYNKPEPVDDSIKSDDDALARLDKTEASKPQRLSKPDSKLKSDQPKKPIAQPESPVKSSSPTATVSLGGDQGTTAAQKNGKP